MFDKDFIFLECKSRAPLGMSSGYISSNQLRVQSSYSGKENQPSQARLHLSSTMWYCGQLTSTSKCWFQVCVTSLNVNRSTLHGCAVKVVICKYNAKVHVFIIAKSSKYVLPSLFCF